MPNSCHTYYQETYILRIYSDEASFERRREDFIWLQIVQWPRRREIAVLILPQPHHSETSTSAISPNMQQTALNYNLVFRHETNYLTFLFTQTRFETTNCQDRNEMRLSYCWCGRSAFSQSSWWCFWQTSHCDVFGDGDGDVFDKHLIVQQTAHSLWMVVHVRSNTNTDKKHKIELWD